VVQGWKPAVFIRVLTLFFIAEEVAFYGMHGLNAFTGAGMFRMDKDEKIFHKDSTVCGHHCADGGRNDVYHPAAGKPGTGCSSG
jgi:hypothetical protein